MADRRAVRVFLLYRADLKSWLSRIWLDLGRELTVLVASAVLFATFLYVFNDFLNVQVSSLSVPMRERFAAVACVLVLGLACVVAAHFLRTERWGERGFAPLARALGEAALVIRAFLALRDTTIIVLTHGLAWFGAQRYLIVPSSVRDLVAAEAAMLALTAGLTVLGKHHNQTKVQGARTFRYREFALLDRLLGPVAVWRLRQIVCGSRSARVCLSLALAFIALAAWAAFRGAPEFVAVAASLVAGILTAATLAFQMADDLTTAWTERAFGVSHADFVGAYERVGALLALVVAASVLITTVSLAGPSAALKAAAVAATPVLAAPLLLLQIDGRRPGVNIMLIIIVGLFIGTAVFAHWLSLALLLVLRQYALKSQDGRFYRA